MPMRSMKARSRPVALAGEHWRSCSPSNPTYSRMTASSPTCPQFVRTGHCSLWPQIEPTSHPLQPAYYPHRTGHGRESSHRQ
jgi:hypothetical protein